MSVSLMAVAVVAVGVMLTKQRQERPIPGGEAPAGESQQAPLSLDAIRAAGL